LASITGTPDGPGRVGVSLVDIAAGRYALVGVYRALLDRTATGEGASLKVSLFDAIADWMCVPLLHHDYGAKSPTRVGLNHPSIAPYGAYATGDGGQVVISIQNEREWQRLCAEVLEHPALAGQPEFSDNDARVRNRPALDKAMSAVFSKLTRANLIERLRRAQIAYGSLNSVGDFSRHAQLRRLSAESEAGTIDLVAPPLRIEGDRPAYGRVPGLGEHTESVRREFAA
jgi:crotonobetainyl-CoA:carnitine CoA-transferase CaiB-like acyl-CoA transferase